LCYIAPSLGGKDLGQNLEVVITNRAVTRNNNKDKKALDTKNRLCYIAPSLEGTICGEKEDVIGVKGFKAARKSKR
jgi:hypothetical protein